MFVLSEVVHNGWVSVVLLVKLLAHTAASSFEDTFDVKFDRELIDLGKMLQLIKMKILSTLTADSQTTRFGLDVEGIAAAINEPGDDACDDAVAGGLRAILAQLIGEGWINQVYDLGYSTSDGTLFYTINPSKNPGSEYANVESVDEMSSSIVTSDVHCSICWETELDMEWTDKEKTRVSLAEKFCANRVLQMFLLENHFGTGCNHCFHSGCIYRWIDTQKENNLQPDCPICRRAIGPQKLLEFQQWKARAAAKAEAKAASKVACERRKNFIASVFSYLNLFLDTRFKWGFVALFVMYIAIAIGENGFNLGLITRAGHFFFSWVLLVFYLCFACVSLCFTCVCLCFTCFSLGFQLCFLGCFTCVSLVFHLCFASVSLLFHLCFLVFHLCHICVSLVFHLCITSVSLILAVTLISALFGVTLCCVQKCLF
jgi:hypothetical protein